MSVKIIYLSERKDGDSYRLCQAAALLKLVEQ